jgi:hypothetical protein
MEHMNITLEHKERSASGDSDTGSCTEAPNGAAGWDPVEQRAGETPLTGEEHRTPSSLISGHLEGLTEVAALGLRVAKKHRCGAAKKLARKAKLAEDPIGDSSGGQP